MMDEVCRKVTLPIGLLHEGKRCREATIGPLSGKSLMQARSFASNRRIDPRLFIAILKDGLREIEGVPAVSDDVIRRLSWADAQFIFWQMALIEAELAEEEPKVSRTCPSCGERVDFPVDLKSLEVKKIEDIEGLDPDGLLPFKLRVPITTLDPQRTPYQEGRMGFLTVDDQLKLFNMGEDLGRITLHALAMAIAELGPVTKGQLSYSDLLELPAAEIKRLERLYNEHEPGVTPPSEGICPRCGAEVVFDPPVDFVADFLLFTR